MSKKFRTFLLSLTNCPNTPHKNLHIFKYAYVYIYVVYKQSMYIFVLCVSLVNCLNPKKVPKAFLDFFGFLLFRMCSRSVPIMFPSSSQCVPQVIPNRTTYLSHMLCPKLSSFHLPIQMGPKGRYSIWRIETSLSGRLQGLDYFLALVLW